MIHRGSFQPRPCCDSVILREGVTKPEQEGGQQWVVKVGPGLCVGERPCLVPETRACNPLGTSDGSNAGYRHAGLVRPGTEPPSQPCRGCRFPGYRVHTRADAWVRMCLSPCVGEQCQDAPSERCGSVEGTACTSRLRQKDF